MTVFKFLFQSSNIVARTAVQFAVVGMAGSIGVSVAATSASASLDAVANNTTPQAIATGTLSLTQANGAGSTGFGSTFTTMAPGDSLTYYVNYTNGSLPAQNLYLSINETSNNLLTRDATKGLTVAVSRCSVAWTFATGVCSGTTTSMLATTAVSTLNTTSGAGGAEATIFTGTTAASDVKFLKFVVALPNQTETTVNGVAPGGTIQGLSNSITWKLREIQGAVVANNS